MNKIFGAVAIIGLFLISSIASTGLAARTAGGQMILKETGQQQAQQQGQQVQEQQYMEGEEEDSWYYDDDEIPLDGYDGESLAYPLDLTIVAPDLFVTRIFKIRRILFPEVYIGIIVRNIGLWKSNGGTLYVNILRKFFHESYTIRGPIIPFRCRRFYIGPWNVNQFDTSHLVFCRWTTPDDEGGPIRNFNMRAGIVLGCV